MLDFLRQLHHLPCGLEDGFIALFLPELDVEGAVGVMAAHEAGLPFRAGVSIHRPYCNGYGGWPDSASVTNFWRTS